MGIWRYGCHLPVRDEEAWLGMGEEVAPVVAAPDLAADAGVGEVWLALAFLGPTGSFKDRAAAAGVAHAVQHGAPGIVCASSGNAAAAAAAYAARAGLPSVVVVPEATPAPKLALARAFGSIALRVPGDYSASFGLARELCARLGFANLATTYVNPTAVAALRTVAFELAWRLGPARLDRVLVPTGAGALVHGVAAGFRYLAARGEACGEVWRVPRVDAVQLTGCAPIVSAFERDASSVTPWQRVTTSVSGLNDPLSGYPDDGTVTLQEVRKTGGVAVAVSDEASFAAAEWLATRHGIFVEPAAATSVAALRELAAEGQLSSDDVVACLLTGHGVKTLDTNADRGTPAPLVHTADEAVPVLREVIR